MTDAGGRHRGALAFVSVDSSLIFLLVIGLWLAYLVPSWVRRREQLSASRSNDRFSAAMRVLDRREDVPERPAAPSYLRTPLRAARSSEGEATDEVDEPLLEVVDRGRSRPPVLAAASVAMLVLAVLAVPGTAGLAVLALAPSWSPAVAGATALVLLLALRARARRRTRRGRQAASPRVVTPHAVVLADETPEVVDEDDMTGSVADAPERQESLPGEWTPVPVPLPAYLLKDEVPRQRGTFELDQVTRWYADWRDSSAEPVEPIEAAGCHRPEVDDDDIPTYAPPVRRALGA